MAAEHSFMFTTPFGFFASFISRFFALYLILNLIIFRIQLQVNIEVEISNYTFENLSLPRKPTSERTIWNHFNGALSIFNSLSSA